VQADIKDTCLLKAGVICRLVIQAKPIFVR